MEIGRILKKIGQSASVLFTVITALYALFMMLVNVSSEEVGLEASRLLLIFLFSLFAACAGALLRSQRIARGGRVTLHYLILALAFYLCFLLPASMTAAQAVIGMTVFTVVYALVMALGALFLSRFRKNEAEEEVYQSQFRR